MGGRSGGKALPSRLSAKQARFAAEYLIDLNATQAAIRAGYSEKTAASIGHENLRKPEISRRVQAGVTRLLKKLDLDLERLVQEAARVGVSNIKELFDEHGTLRLVSELSDDTAAAISSVEVTTRNIGDGEEETVTKIRLWPKLQGLELVAKLRNLLKHPPVELTPSDGLLELLREMQAERQAKQ